MRLVLKGHENTRSDLATLGYDLDWLLLKVNTPDLHIEDIWATRDQKTYIHYLEDPITLTHYIVLHGEQAEVTATTIQKNLPVWEHQEALEYLQTAEEINTKIHGIYLTSLTSSSAREDDITVEALLNASKEKDEPVRQATIVATGYLGWSKLLNLLQYMSEKDDSDTVRHDAELMLEALNKEPSVQ